MLLKAARRVEVCPASTLAAVLLSGLAGGVAEPESRMWGHCKGPDELGLLEAATHVDAQTCTLRLELAYRHRLQLYTVRVVAGRRRIICLRWRRFC